MWSDQLYGALAASRIIVVVVIDDKKDAVPTARALARGGITHVELALRTDASLAALEAISREVPEMTVGAGTVLLPAQVRAARDAGAHFAVSPGLSPAVVAEAEKIGLPFAPGIATPTDIEKAWNMGCRVLKLFPANPMGGAKYLKSVNAAYRHLGLSFIPLGGVRLANLDEWLAMPEILAVGGSWPAADDLIRAGKWDEIETNAQAATEQIAKLRPEAGGGVGQGGA
ncbi:bifunctional 4-hydroxy-2-oxoglutarate aldolase/2-dehydro-3-deoxy-phosphogluconate aldolase [Alkalispirochaeta americana]|nr:bifunctional 4-hydroxy-2-oxoglutarate aldolase/2-dehydro-3-deoxy-phosphogluconate aldolase [Alkalispirochaeta americana]